MVGIIAGVVLLTYIPRISRSCAWFSIDRKYQSKILHLFGKYPGFSMSEFPGLTEIHITFNLVRWFDNSNPNDEPMSAHYYLDDILKTLHENDLKEVTSGVY